MLVDFLWVVLAAYLLGSIPAGVIGSRFAARRDVREVGSGHTGALNTYRAAGFTAALFTFVADGAKTIVALQLARVVTASDWGVALAGIAVVIGHCYPIYTRFHGGMGLATGGVALFSFDALVVIVIVLAWFPLKFFLKKSPRASAITALLLPILLVAARVDAPLVLFGAGAGTVIFLRHLGDWHRQTVSALTKS